MADNVTANAGSGGAVFATDDIGGVHYPLNKLGFGALDSFTIVSTSNGLPVQQQGTFTVQPGNTANTTAWLVTGTGGSFPVTDSGGSLTVDNGGTFVVQENGAALTSLQLIDNLVLLEDVAHGTGDPGVQMLSVRKDTAAATSGTDGDYQPLVTDASGRLHVNVGTSALPTGASTESTLSTLNGKVTAVNTGAVVLAAGTAAFGKLSANSGVDIGDVDVTSLVPGTSATSLGKAEDAAHASGDTGVMALGVRRDSAAASSGSDGDYEPFSTDNVGQLRVNVGNTVTVGSHAVTNAGTFAVQAAQSGTWNVTNISGTVSLPTGASTAAKQPALGTAGTASSDVITVQGIASMTALKVDGSAVTQPVSIAAAVTANLAPTTSGGLLISRTLSAANTNSANIKASAGQLYNVFATTTATGPRYVKIYNKASAPVVASDTPVLTLMVPSNGTNGAGLNWEAVNGVAFGTGIAIAITGAIGDTDTTAIGANDTIVNLLYK